MAGAAAEQERARATATAATVTTAAAGSRRRRQARHHSAFRDAGRRRRRAVRARAWAARRVSSGTAGDGEAGGATAELVVATPLLLLLITLVIQFALWQHGLHVAAAAAEEGERAARLEGGSAAAGAARAREFLAALGPSVVVAPQVTASRSATTARVEIRGSAAQLVPWLHLPIHAVAEGPVEAFTPDNPGFAIPSAALDSGSARPRPGRAAPRRRPTHGQPVALARGGGPHAAEEKALAGRPATAGISPVPCCAPVPHPSRHPRAGPSEGGADDLS